MGYKVSVTFADGVGTRPFDLIDSNGDVVVDEIRIKEGINKVSAFGGANFGYVSGGVDYPSIYKNTIERFPFAIDFDETDVGDLTVGRSSASGASSSTHGYTAGGWDGTRSNVIDKFQFVATSNATDVGDMVVGRSHMASTHSPTHGYSSGGYTGPPFLVRDNIDKFSFSVDGNATDVGNLNQGRGEVFGQTSSTHGYTSGGNSSPAGGVIVNTIDKFPFSSDNNATDVGDLTVAKFDATGLSSDVAGYSGSGNTNSTTSDNTLDKFPFASDANARDAGDLSSSVTRRAGVSSKTDGYLAGGNLAPAAPPVDYQNIHKFPFATDAAQDMDLVGYLPNRRNKGTGTQI